MNKKLTSILLGTAVLGQTMGIMPANAADVAAPKNTEQTTQQNGFKKYLTKRNIIIAAGTAAALAIGIPTFVWAFGSSNTDSSDNNGSQPHMPINEFLQKFKTLFSQNTELKERLKANALDTLTDPNCFESFKTAIKSLKDFAEKEDSVPVEKLQKDLEAVGCGIPTKENLELLLKYAAMSNNDATKTFIKDNFNTIVQPILNAADAKTATALCEQAKINITALVADKNNMAPELRKKCQSALIAVTNKAKAEGEIDAITKTERTTLSKAITNWLNAIKQARDNKGFTGISSDTKAKICRENEQPVKDALNAYKLRIDSITSLGADCKSAYAEYAKCLAEIDTMHNEFNGLNPGDPYVSELKNFLDTEAPTYNLQPILNSVTADSQ